MCIACKLDRKKGVAASAKKRLKAHADCAHAPRTVAMRYASTPMPASTIPRLMPAVIVARKRAMGMTLSAKCCVDKQSAPPRSTRKSAKMATSQRMTAT